MESYSCGPDYPILEITLGQALDRTAERFPHQDAVVARRQGIRLTYSQLREGAVKVARGLWGLGLRPGDRIGAWASNCVEWLLLQHATARIGTVLINVNPAYRSHELAFVLRKSHMKALFLHEADARSNYLEILNQARAGLECPLEHVVLLGTDSWHGMLEKGVDPPSLSLSANDAVNIQYTSGTTGSPKGVLLTHRNLVNNGWVMGWTLKLGERDRICVPVPLYHCFGCVLGSICATVYGAALVLPSPQFEPLATLEAVEAERCTVIYGVPTMFIAELDHPEFRRFDLSSLRTGIMAGAPCPIEVMKRVVNVMGCREMTIGYGQTESSPVITGSLTDDSLELRVSTVGRALPNTEVKIAGPGLGETVEVGEQGELCTRGYLVMKGYDEEPEATARAIDSEGWLHTGDLATMRPDGYFRITGRAKEMIIRGGENIYPREIEEFLYTHPKIADVYVVGLPDARLGEAVLAAVRLKAGETATEDSIRDFCKGRIAHFKIPQYISFVDSFPMTVTGKIQKYRIREREIQARGLEAAAAIKTA